MTAFASNTLKQKENIVRPECEWGYRLMGVVVAFLIIFSCCFIAVTIRDNIIAVKFNQMMKDVYKFSAKHGLYVEDVVVDGNYRA